MSLDNQIIRVSKQYLKSTFIHMIESLIEFYIPELAMINQLKYLCLLTHALKCKSSEGMEGKMFCLCSKNFENSFVNCCWMYI